MTEPTEPDQADLNPDVLNALKRAVITCDQCGTEFLGESARKTPTCDSCVAKKEGSNA